MSEGEINIDDINDREFYRTLEELIEGHKLGVKVTDLLDTTAIKFVLRKRVVELERMKGRQRDLKVCQIFIDIIEKEAAEKEGK
ncbi:MAG: hypothetical protein ACM3UZ_03445 [Acidobacteriota bacterium]